MTSDVAVVQLDPDQCGSYSRCQQCVVDPYCVWYAQTDTCRSRAHNTRLYTSRLTLMYSVVRIRILDKILHWVGDIRDVGLITSANFGDDWLRRF